MPIPYLKFVVQIDHRLALLGVEEQEFAILLTNVLDADVDPGGESDVHTVTLPQLDGITANVDLYRGAGGGTSVVTGPLDKMGVHFSAPSGVGERGGGGKDGG